MKNEWKQHDGKIECPVDKGQKIEYRYLDGEVRISYFPEILDWGWDHGLQSDCIVEYRLIADDQHIKIKEHNHTICLMAATIVSGLVSRESYEWRDVDSIEKEAISIATSLYNTISNKQ